MKAKIKKRTEQQRKNMRKNLINSQLYTYKRWYFFIKKHFTRLN